MPTSNSLSHYVALPQGQSEWCWAACTASISQFYDQASPWTQGKLVDRAFPGNQACAFNGLAACNGRQHGAPCCSNGSQQSCNKSFQPNVALGWTGNLAAPKNYVIPIGDIVAEIDAGHPVSVNLLWNGGSTTGHNVVIVGYDVGDPANPLIDIADPQDGSIHVGLGFNDFPANYGPGAAWTDTFLTR